METIARPRPAKSGQNKQWLFAAFVLVGGVVGFVVGGGMYMLTGPESTASNPWMVPKNFEPGETKAGDLTYALTEVLPARCIRLYFLTEEDSIIKVSVCPQDLTEEKKQALEGYESLPFQIRGRTYQYNFEFPDEYIVENGTDTTQLKKMQMIINFMESQ